MEFIVGVTVGDEREHPPSPFPMDVLFDPIAPRQLADWRLTASPDTPERPVGAVPEAALIMEPPSTIAHDSGATTVGAEKLDSYVQRYGAAAQQSASTIIYCDPASAFGLLLVRNGAGP